MSSLSLIFLFLARHLRLTVSAAWAVDPEIAIATAKCRLHLDVMVVLFANLRVLVFHITSVGPNMWGGRDLSLPAGWRIVCHPSGGVLLATEPRHGTRHIEILSFWQRFLTVWRSILTDYT